MNNIQKFFSAVNWDTFKIGWQQLGGASGDGIRPHTLYRNLKTGEYRTWFHDGVQGGTPHEFPRRIYPAIKTPIPLDKGCPPDCKCDSYCVIKAHAKFYNEEGDKLQHPWPAPTHSTVAKPTDIFLFNVQIHLEPDGTYNLSDTSGG